MTDEHRMTPAELVDRLRAEVPEASALIDAHLEEYAELLLHVLLADLRRLLVAAFRTGDRAFVDRGIALLDRALTDGDDAVTNAVAVSFVEGAGHEVADFVEVWPLGLRAELDRQQASG